MMSKTAVTMKKNPWTISSSNNNNNNRNNNKQTKKTWRCDYCKECVFDDYNKACIHEKECQKKKQTNNNNKQQKHKWVCDCCKKCSFDDFQEACIHEEKCWKQHQQQKTSFGVQITPTPPSRTSSCVKSSAASPDNDNDDVIELLETTTEHNKNNEKNDGFDPMIDEDLVEIVEESTNNKKESSENIIEILETTTTEDENDNDGDPMDEDIVKTVSSDDKNKTDCNNKPIKNLRRSNRTSTKPKTTPLMFDKQQQRGTKRKTTKQTKIETKQKKQNTDNNNNKKKLEKECKTNNNNKKLKKKSTKADVLDPKVLAEQRALEFMIQRRQKEQLEREKNERRRIRREQERQQKMLLQKNDNKSNDLINIDGDDDDVVPVKKTTAIENSNKKTALGVKTKQLPLAPRFPNPSHIIPHENNQDNYTTNHKLHVTDSMVKVTTSQLDEVLHENKSPYQYLLPDTNDDESNVVSVLQSEFAKCLIPRNKSIPCLVDKYYNNITSDVLMSGASIQNARVQLTEFIEHFMVQRHKAVMRMEAKKENCTRKNKKSRKTYKDDDDYLWEDDEEEGPGSRTTLCLITGPVGCGKSSLVHRVANGLGCRKVIELHTGNERGGAALRSHIEEATKSHSTLDMMHNKSKQNAAAAAFFQRRQELVDSDEESDGEDENGKEKGSSVTVILIDEADILYESDGDAGFWTALNEVCKVSKCPIILTANKIPKEMRLIAFTHIEVQRPTSTECAKQIEDIVEMEKIENHNENSNNFEQIATLANCDMRRILFELGLFASSSQPRKEVDTKSIEIFTETSNFKRNIDENYGIPRIQSVSPKAIKSDQYSLITIKGSNFSKLACNNNILDGNSGTPCSVSVGDQNCVKAVVLDDSTVLAVCSPLIVSPFLDEAGNYQGTRRRSVDAAYAPISVSNSSQPTGILSTSNSHVIETELPDGSKIASLDTPVLLEIHYPGYTHCRVTRSPSKKNDNEDADSDSEEFVFEFDENPKTNTSHVLSLNPGKSDAIDFEKVNKLLEEGIEAFKSQEKVKVTHDPIPLETRVNNQSEVDALSENICLMSDAALLEDIGIDGVPYLSGSCRGFGFDLTEEFPKRTNENSKPPSEERLFSANWVETCYFYGDPDAFVAYPCRSREKLLLRRNESAARGCAFDFVDSIEASEESFLCEFATEEDMLLPQFVPRCIRSLPNTLKKKGGVILASDCTINLIHERNARDNISESRNLLQHFIFAGARDTSMYYRTMRRETDFPFCLSECMNREVFVDYLPIIRMLCLVEAVAEARALLNKGKELDGETNTSRRRRTRRSANRREHYLEKVVPHFVWHGTELTAPNVGERFAAMTLKYS